MPGQGDPVTALPGQLGLEAVQHAVGIGDPGLGGLGREPRGPDRVALGQREHGAACAREEPRPSLVGLVGQQVEGRELAAHGAQVELLQRGGQAPRVRSQPDLRVGLVPDQREQPQAGAQARLEIVRPGMGGQPGVERGGEQSRVVDLFGQAHRVVGEVRRETSVPGVLHGLPERLASACLEIPRPHAPILGAHAGPVRLPRHDTDRVA